MRLKTLLLAGILCFAVGAAGADEYWKGPGWYVMAYQFAIVIWSGPYDSQNACEQAKPADDDPPGFSYDCQWLDHDPG